MIDKVQKIRNEVVRLMNELIQEKEKGFGSDVDDACILELQNVLTYIDSLQEEPAPKIFEDILNAVTPAKSLGISAEEHDKIVDECLYGKEPELVDEDDLPNKEEEPKFNVGDTIYNKELTVFIYDISEGKYWVKDVSDTFDFGYLEVSKQDEWKLVEKPVSEDLEEAIKTIKLLTSNTALLTFEYGFRKGAKWQNEQMMAKAIDATCFGFQGAALFSFRLPAGSYLIGSKVKVIVIKEE